MGYTTFSVFFFAMIGSCLAVCPHEDPGLAMFSSLFPGNLENTEVDIQSPVLLDVPNLSVKRIIISGNGKLVFGRDIDITLRTKAILVKDNGALIIGSVDCRHTDEVNIILEGLKAQYPELVGPAGEEKYIIVQDKGVLSLHGADKRAWTKIDSTLERSESFINDPTLVKYIHQNSSNVDTMAWIKGLALYRVNSDNTVAEYAVLNLKRNNVNRIQRDIGRLETALTTLPDGQIMSIAIQNFFEPTPGADLTSLLDTLEKVAGMQSGELLLRQADKNTAFTVMFMKGGPYSQSLERPNYEGKSTAKSSLDLGDYKVVSVSNVVTGSVSESFIDLRIIHKSIGYPIVTVVHDITSWNKGDQVILTSTDYDARHTEVFEIKDIPSWNQVMLSDEPNYRHFGEIEHRVDMRSELALITRNIKIQGQVEETCPVVNGNCEYGFDSFGGQIKIISSFGEVHIQGVELFHMGQLGVMGAYPIHFHMCLNITGSTALLESNSIHHTFQRAVTVHCTYGTSVEQPGVVLNYNVAYHVFGHTFFLEDGGESATIFNGNLGAMTKNIETGFFSTDATEAATYWITNPEVVLIGNVAAGSENGVGIWYVFPDEPVGPCTGVRFTNGEAFETGIWTFDNNIVHSNDRAGFQMSKKILDGFGNLTKNFEYVPKEKSQITRLTSYKNRRRNAWIRGGAQFMQYSSAESNVGIAMARASRSQQQFASKIVMIGASEKNGEQEGYPDAFTPQNAKFHPGVELIYGPQYITDAWFGGYKSYSDGSYVAGGIGFKRKSSFAISELTSFRNLRFGFSDPSDGNKVFNFGPANANIGHENLDGNEVQSFRDVDGSVYACDQLPFDGTKQFVKPEKYLLTDNCWCRNNWQMCACDNLYGSAKIDARLDWTGNIENFNKSVIAKRIKFSDQADTAYENHLATTSTPRTLMVLGNTEYYYEVEFTEGFPKKMLIEIDGVEWNHDVVVGVCLPEGANKNNVKLNGRVGNTKIENFKLGESLEGVASDMSMQTVYAENRILYLHFVSNVTRDPMHDTSRCIGGDCPRFTIQMKEELSYTPCFSPSLDELSTDFMPELANQLTCTYPAATYEDNWGVGDTFASHDGQWGEWSAWSDCATSQTGYITRTRLCDSPTPYKDGNDCVGEQSQSVLCAILE